jgi:hypothetical protein
MRRGSRTAYRATQASDRRSGAARAPSPDNSMRPGSAGAMGSQATEGGDVHVVGVAGQAQAVAHGVPEAVGKHSQVQLWWRDATIRPGR